MTTVADYQVLADNEFVLDASTNEHERTFTFSFTQNFVHGTFRAKPIFAFRFRPFEESRVTVIFNHREIISVPFAASVGRCFWEAFSPADVFPDRANIPDDVPIRLIVSSGRVRFSDIVVWYQVDV